MVDGGDVPSPRHISEEPPPSLAERRSCPLERFVSATAEPRGFVPGRRSLTRALHRAPPRSSRLERSAHFASGSGRTWMCTARGLEPLPPSISHGVRSPFVLHSPRPFQPAFGSSIRPSRPLAKKPIGYGTRTRIIRPSLSAAKPSCRFAVEIGTFSPRPAVLW